jgi:hypothetical protein
MMAAPNGPDDETWKKMSTAEKRVHRVLNIVVFAIILYFVFKDLS